MARPRRACRRRRGRRAWRSCRCRRASGRRPCRGTARSCASSRRALRAARTARRDPRPGNPARSPPGGRASEKSVSASDVRSARSCPCCSTRKNQLPPQATSPVTGPWPGTSTVTSLRSRQLGTFSTVTSPFSCSVAVTMPTGVSMRCSPGRMRPEVRQRGDQPDGPVAAHAEVADVVEEDDAGGAGACPPARRAARRRSRPSRAAR